MVGYIYKSVIAGKVYIGKTTSKLDSRIKTHLNHAFKQNSQTKICQALRTLSEEDAYNSFSVIEMITGNDYNDLELKLCERENYYMSFFDSMWPNGYNVNRSYPQKQRVVTSQPPRESVMREVICVETGEHFKSLAEASRASGICISAIGHCLKGKNNVAGGKHWRYADGEYHECHRPEGVRNKKSQSKPVMCKETGIIYPSCGEAGRQTGIISTSIAKCANGKVISAGGLHWGFVVDGKPIFHNRPDYNRTRIRCLETGEIFESMADCARSLGEKNSGTLQSTIKYGCKHKGKTYVKIDQDGNPVPSSWKQEKV